MSHVAVRNADQLLGVGALVWRAGIGAFGCLPRRAVPTAADACNTDARIGFLDQNVRSMIAVAFLDVAVSTPYFRNLA
jgi:hypothetical protein